MYKDGVFDGGTDVDKKIVSLYLTPYAEDIIYTIHLSKDGASKCGEEKSKEFEEGL